MWLIEPKTVVTNRTQMEVKMMDFYLHGSPTDDYDPYKDIKGVDSFIIGAGQSVKIRSSIYRDNMKNMLLYSQQIHVMHGNTKIGMLHHYDFTYNKEIVLLMGDDNKMVIERIARK